MPTDTPPCVDPDLIAVPDPGSLKLDCKAGIVVDPPPPPIPRYILLRIKEEGPDKQFRSGVLPGGLPYRSEDWVLGVATIPDTLTFGEKVLLSFGSSVVVPGAGVNFGGEHTPLYGEILLGYRNGSASLAPAGDLQHMTPNSIWIMVPNIWHGKSAPLNIESYTPFRATACLTNLISGQPDYTQVAQFFQGSPVYQYSPNANVLAGSTIKVVVEEYTPVFP